MKKIIIGFTSCLGVISSILAIMNVLPQYNIIFFVLIGISVGYALGYFASSRNPENSLNAKERSLLFMVIMFFAPPLVIICFIIVIWKIGFMSEAILKIILDWGILIILIAYITAGVVCNSWSNK